MDESSLSSLFFTEKQKSSDLHDSVFSVTRDLFLVLELDIDCFLRMKVVSSHYFLLKMINKSID